MIGAPATFESNIDAAAYMDDTVRGDAWSFQAVDFQNWKSPLTLLLKCPTLEKNKHTCR